MKIIVSLLLCSLCLGWTAPLTAQDCEFEPDSKVSKLLEKARDKKKYDFGKRMEFFQDALDQDENCLPCLHEMGIAQFKTAKRGGSFAPALESLKSLVEKCPDYHSDVYYYIGAIEYADQHYDEALEAFDYFLKFPDDDPTKFKRDYDKKYDEVKEAMEGVQFWKDFYNNGEGFDPDRVGGVSSEGNDYLPCLSPDGEIMFFTRSVSKQAKGDLVRTQREEFTWSFRPDINANFDGGESLPRPFNFGSTNYGGATISVDNKQMIIAVKNPVADNDQNIDLYATSYTYGWNEANAQDQYSWSELEPLGAGVNTDRGWEAQPSLSGDGMTLFFAKIGPGCIPNPNGDFSTDLFFSERQEDGSWGNAQPLPDIINTPGVEKAPYMHSDSKTLYFVSNGHMGRGGLDIFYTRQQDDGTWTKPRNMGHPFNTDGDELGMIVSADGELAYFVSRSIRGSRMQDIYSIPMPEHAKPEKVVVLKGTVKDEEGQPRQGAKVKLTYAQSREIQEIDIASDDGTYAAIVNVERNEDVVMSVEQEGLAFNSRIIAEKDVEEQPSVVKLKVTTEEIKRDKPFLINDIYYRTNSADINESSQHILTAFAEYLQANPNLYIEIRGHTDNVGSDGDNLALSMDRAFEVKSFLEKKGVAGKRVTARGYGESKPVASNDNADGRAQNRRTEFVIKKM